MALEIVKQFSKLLKNPSVLHTTDAFLSGLAWEITAGLVNPGLKELIVDWNTTPSGKAIYNTSFGAITGLVAAVTGTVLTCLVAEDIPQNVDEWKSKYLKEIGKILISSFAPEFLWQLINWSLEELVEKYELNEATKYAIGSLAFFMICTLSFQGLAYTTQANWKSWSLSSVVGMSSTSFFWFAALTERIDNLFLKSLASGSSAALGATAMHLLFFLFSSRQQILTSMHDCYNNNFGDDYERLLLNNVSLTSYTHAESLRSTRVADAFTQREITTNQEDMHDTEEIEPFFDAIEFIPEEEIFFDADSGFTEERLYHLPLKTLSISQLNRTDLISAINMAPLPQVRLTIKAALTPPPKPLLLIPIAA